MSYKKQLRLAKNEMAIALQQRNSKAYNAVVNNWECYLLLNIENAEIIDKAEIFGYSFAQQNAIPTLLLSVFNCSKLESLQFSINLYNSASEKKVELTSVIELLYLKLETETDRNIHSFFNKFEQLFENQEQARLNILKIRDVLSEKMIKETNRELNNYGVYFEKSETHEIVLNVFDDTNARASKIFALNALMTSRLPFGEVNGLKSMSIISQISKDSRHLQSESKDSTGVCRDFDYYFSHLFDGFAELAKAYKFDFIYTDFMYSKLVNYIVNKKKFDFVETIFNSQINLITPPEPSTTRKKTKEESKSIKNLKYLKNANKE